MGYELLLVPAIFAFGFLRLEVLHRIRLRAIDIIGEENQRRIHAPDLLTKMKPLLPYLTERERLGIDRSYGWMLFQLHKWKLRDFFPDVADLERATDAKA
jgi:hypothetical protein